MNTKYDKIADAIYVTFKKGKVFKTLKLDNKLIVDLDGNFNVLGVELLNAKSQLSSISINKINKIQKINNFSFA